MKKILLLYFVGLNFFCFSQKTEMLNIDFCTDVINKDTNKVYANIIIKNLTKKTIGYLADKGYALNPQVIFGVSDSIVSDTLYFNLYHPKYILGEYDRCFDCKNDSISTFFYSNKEFLILKKRKSNTIKLVFTEVQYKLIKHVKINIYSFYITKNGSDSFEKKVYIFSKPFDCIGIVP